MDRLNPIGKRDFAQGLTILGTLKEVENSVL